MVALLLALSLSISVRAAVFDYGPPQDLVGNWKVDLYDSTGAQRGTSANPLYFSFPADTPSTPGSISTQDVGSTTVTQFSGQQSVSGTPTPASSVTYPLASTQAAMIMVTGTWTGTLQVEVSSDGGASYQPRALHVLGSAVFASSITSNVVGSINATAKTSVRVRAISPITGSATVKFLASDNLSNIYVANPVKITDSTTQTNPPGLTIRAGATGAQASDTAAVVESRPWQSRVISGNTTVQVKAGAGVIHAIIVGAPTGGSITAYDSLSGSGTTLTFMFAGTPSGGLLTTSGYPSPESVGLDVAFSTGLTVVTQGSNQNSFTVIYR